MFFERDYSWKNKIVTNDQQIANTMNYFSSIVSKRNLKPNLINNSETLSDMEE